jgi:hypothetical protein
MAQRACDAREAVRERLPTLRRKWTRAETVATKYQKAIEFQNIELKLAFMLISSIRRYARRSQCDIQHGPTAPHQF